MVIVERPNEGLKYIRKLVTLKLHNPLEFKLTLSEIEQNHSSLMFQKIIQAIDKLISMEYKVKHVDESVFDHWNSSNYVCFDNSELEYPDQWEILKFWLNRVGLVSISNSIEKTIRTLYDICKLCTFQF